MFIKIDPIDLQDAIIDYLNKKLGATLSSEDYMEIFVTAREQNGKKSKLVKSFLIPQAHCEKDEIEIFIELNNDWSE